MSTLVLATASAVIGFTIGGPVGAQIGWQVGPAVGELYFPPSDTARAQQDERGESEEASHVSV